MRVREIITLQVGHASNYVGAHFWNSQDSYIDYSDDGNHGDKAVASTPTSAEVNPHVLYRSGTGSAQSGAIETFTPRLVSVDLKGESAAPLERSYFNSFYVK